MSELKISDELKSIIIDEQETSLDKEIRVIVSISDDVEMEDVKTELVKNGLRIESMIPGPIQVVSGIISLKAISKLAKVSEVKKIEYDSKVYTQ
jgi:hypothetical protein